MKNFIVETQGNNSFLVYTLDQTESIDTFSSGMLTNNKISGIVPYSYSVLDEARYFKYNITSKTSLRQFFSGVVNRKRLTEVLLSMTSTLLALDDYMLLPQCTVIDSSHIFVDISTNKAWLIYLPLLEEQYEELTIAEFIKQTIFSIQYDQSENCDYVAKLMNFVNANSEFSLVEFERMLKSLGPTEQRQGPVNVAPAPNIMQQPQVAQQAQAQVSVTPKQQKSAAKDKPAKNMPVQQQPIPPTPAVSQVKPPGIPSGKGFNIPGVTNSAPAVVAPVKPPKESKKSSIFSLFNKKDKKKSETDITPEFPQLEEQVFIPPMYKASVQQPQLKSSENVVPIVASNAGETTLLGLANNGETTLLGVGGNPMNQTARPYLTRTKNGQVLYIDKPVFKLGKEKSYVDFFVGDNTAISRSHADIITRNGEYYVLDNSSTNHTFVDDIMIPSQQEVKIGHGAKIKLANEQFEFKLF